MPTQSPRLGKPRAKRQLKPKHASSEYRYLYNKNKWKVASKAFRDQHPLCECDECKQRVVPLPAEVVDHIIPHKGDVVLFWDRENWQSMAKKCHDKKTVKEDGGFGNKVNGR